MRERMKRGRERGIGRVLVLTLSALLAQQFVADDALRVFGHFIFIFKYINLLAIIFCYGCVCVFVCTNIWPRQIAVNNLQQFCMNQRGKLLTRRRT